MRTVFELSLGTNMRISSVHVEVGIVNITSKSKKYLNTIEPRQANLCLRAFRHDKFQLRMPSYSDGPGIWLSV